MSVCEIVDDNCVYGSMQTEAASFSMPSSACCVITKSIKSIFKNGAIQSQTEREVRHSALYSLLRIWNIAFGSHGLIQRTDVSLWYVYIFFQLKNN